MKGKDNGVRLSLSQKWTRLKERMRDPQWRKYAGLVYAGKILGVGGVLFIMLGLPVILREAPKVISRSAYAEEKPAPAPAPTPTPVTTPETHCRACRTQSCGHTGGWLYPHWPDRNLLGVRA